ncbi:MAG: glycosyltransferase family 1 protein [Sphingomicrobium sp.]
MNLSADTRAPAAARTYPPGSRFLIDVSRLIWRIWSGRLPTGVDRVCLAYIEHFGPRALAVVQRRGHLWLLSSRRSEQLFGLLLNGHSTSRLALLAFVVKALPSARRSVPRQDMLYFNVGHTGLDEPTLPAWIARNRVRAIYFIHDLIPLTHPEFCRLGEADRHKQRLDNVLASAFGVIGNSKTTIEDLAGFAAERGVYMPPRVAAWISGHQPPARAERQSLPRPFFLTIGTIEGRKNHLLLLNVWNRLVQAMGDAAPILVIIGQRGWKAEPVTALLDDLQELRSHVLEFGSCDDGELASWIAGARAVLMPSLAEGFGLPVIEALQLGTPVIVSDLPVYREILGDIPTYLQPLDERAWEQVIVEFMADSLERDRQIAAMRGYHPPRWDEHFRQVEEWLETLQASSGLRDSA